MNGKFLLIESILIFLPSCTESFPDNCVPNASESGCTIQYGDYKGFSNGMSKSDAFENLCRLVEAEEILGPNVQIYPIGSNPVAPEGDFRRFFVATGDVCQSRDRFMDAYRWTPRESTFWRDRGIFLKFEGDKLVEIQLKYFGMDP